MTSSSQERQAVQRRADNTTYTLKLKWLPSTPEHLSTPHNTHNKHNMIDGVQIHSKVALEAQAEILTDGALKFLAALHRTFESTRQTLLIARESAQLRLDSGLPLEFPPETAHIRADPSWQCAPPAPGLEDRRVEITGPTDRKMVVNALNSGSKTFMADFEGISM